MFKPSPSTTSRLALAGLIVVTVAQSGCSVFMAARAPAKKDLAVLTPGVKRSRVVAELGAPIASTPQPYGSSDVFAFKQGYSMPTKFSRAVVHGAADLFTVGLWEVAGTPIEASLQGEEVRAEVAYSPDGIVRRVEFYSGAHLAHGGPTLADWMRTKKTEQTSIVGNIPDANGSLEEPGIFPADGVEDAGVIQQTSAEVITDEEPASEPTEPE